MKTLNFLYSGRAKIVLLAGLSAIALFGVGSTSTGQQLFAQMGISDSFAKTTDAASRIVENGNNAVQAFLGRSPGERGVTDILKGKAKRPLAENDVPKGKPKPTQRALGKIFDDPLKSLAGPITPDPVVEFIPIGPTSTLSTIPAIALTVPGGPGGGGFIGGGGSFIGGGGGGTGGGSGGGSGGDGVVPPPPAPPPPAAAVPEPSTWTLLLIGFAAVGASIRRAKKAQNKSALERAGNCATA